MEFVGFRRDRLQRVIEGVSFIFVLEFEFLPTTPLQVCKKI